MAIRGLVCLLGFKSCLPWFWEVWGGWECQCLPCRVATMVRCGCWGCWPVIAWYVDYHLQLLQSQANRAGSRIHATPRSYKVTPWVLSKLRKSPWALGEWKGPMIMNKFGATGIFSWLPSCYQTRVKASGTLSLPTLGCTISHTYSSRPLS